MRWGHTYKISSVKVGTRKTNTGFSLVELLVVIAILAVLAAIAIPLFLNQKAKAVDAETFTDVRNLSGRIATMMLTPNPTITGSGSANVSPTITVGDQVEQKSGASVFVDDVGAWCVSKISETGNIFVTNSQQRTTYQADLPCLTATTNPAKVGTLESVTTALPVVESLKFYLDPGNPKSYPGTGTLWYDLASTNQNTMNLVGNPTLQTNSFLFNGSYADGGNNNSLTTPTVTVEVFTKATDEALLTHVTNIIGKGNWNGWHWYLGYRSGISLSFSYRTGSGGWGLGPNYNINNFDAAQWYHIVGTHDGTTAHLYLDGTLIASTPATGFTPNNADHNLQIARSSYSGNTYKGNIGIVRIYDRALSAEEINQNYNLDKNRYN